MNRVILGLLLCLTLSISYSQETLVKTFRVKNFESLDQIMGDSVASKFVKELQINMGRYTIVGLDEVVRYSDSLTIQKISHTTHSVIFRFKDTSDYNTEKAIVYDRYERKSTKANSFISSKKSLLCCWRTIEPNEENRYKLYFYWVEG